MEDDFNRRVFVAWHMVRWTYIEVGVHIKDARVVFETAFEGTTNEVEAPRSLCPPGIFDCSNPDINQPAELLVDTFCFNCRLFLLLLCIGTRCY